MFFVYLRLVTKMLYFIDLNWTDYILTKKANNNNLKIYLQ